MGDAITIYKLDEHGKELLSYPGVVVEQGSTWIQVRCVFQVDWVDLDHFVMQRGDIFVEWFYTDRWYNVFRVEHGETGQLKGWYCNVTRPAQIDKQGVRADDLALDVLVMPDGTLHILDEDEFDELNLSADDRVAVWHAVDQIREAVETHTSPFEDVGRYSK
jgi:protein associated with RNAse G/E